MGEDFPLLDLFSQKGLKGIFDYFLIFFKIESILEAVLLEGENRRLELLTIKQAAERLKISDKAVYYAVQTGKLTRHEQYGKVLVSTEEVDAYKPRAFDGMPAGRSAGRPPKRVRERQAGEHSA